MIYENFHIIKYQLLVTFSVNNLFFAHGLILGWLSPSLRLLMSTDSPLEDGPISTEMAGWIGSFLSLGVLSGCLILSYVSKYIGFKKTILSCSLPIIISGLLITFGTAAWQICLSRYFCGFSWGGGMVLAPQFMAEIASDFIRGQLNALTHLSCHLGTLCGYIGAFYLPYETYPMIMIIFPLLFLGSFAFIHETPQYLLHTNKVDLAEKSLRFYRNCPVGNSENEKALQEEFQKFITISKQRESAEKLKLSEFVTPTILRALMISPVLSVVSTFSGAFAITNYAVLVFEQTGSSIDPNISTIVMGVLQVLGTYTASQLMDRLGRKTLLLISMSGGLVALLVTGTFSYLGTKGFDLSSLSILPVISISLYIYICAIGITPVPYIMVTEVLPQRIRRVGSTFYICVVFILSFILLKFFPTMLFTLEVHGSMLFFACVIIIGMLFTCFVVRETKGVNLDDLEVKVKNNDIS